MPSSGAMPASARMASRRVARFGVILRKLKDGCLLVAANTLQGANGPLLHFGGGVGFRQKRVQRRAGFHYVPGTRGLNCVGLGVTRFPLDQLFGPRDPGRSWE